MDIKKAIILFNTLSQETRLNVLRMLVQAGRKGLAAGVLSETLGTPHNTMSFHLNHLSNAGIVTSHREGRSIIYAANFAMIQDLVGFLVKDCCSMELANIQEDKAKGCLIIELAHCCNPKERKIS